MRHWVTTLVQLTDRAQLPAPVLLPAAGAIIGIYSGLLAGVFANLIGLATAASMAFSHPPPGHELWDRLRTELLAKNWHSEMALLVGGPALVALRLAKHISPTGTRALFRKRVTVLSLLVLGALGLFYPLAAMAVLNGALGSTHSGIEHIRALPWWAMMLLPAVGGFAVGHILRGEPHAHGHGIPEVQRSIRRDGEGLGVRSGILKVVASAVTIGSGGSAGREGPIVFGGGALAADVARTLGFTRRELTILVAAGAGAGIAASFNAPIAGAIFAFEIILREFDLKVLSPIILASVSATLVGRGVMGDEPLLRRLPYEMVSGWEVGPYVLLGLICGLLAYAFIRLLHRVEELFQGHSRFRFFQPLGRWKAPYKAALGGVLVGALALANPTVWGTGHDFTNIAAMGTLPFGFLVSACLLKLLATSVTIGSGGSGGTFFPATVMGAMAGGAFGKLLHGALPALTAPSGAYALVGMGGAVAGLTRGPLTAMMMVYELTGNYQIILPLMISCTLSSALCHHLVGLKQSHPHSAREVLAQTTVRELMVPLTAIDETRSVRELVDVIVASGETAIPVRDVRGRVTGLVQLNDLRDIWNDDALTRMLRAADVARVVPVLRAEEDLHAALDAMNVADLDVLPAEDPSQPDRNVGLITRAAIRRHLHVALGRHPTGEHHPVAPTEVER